MKIGPRDTIVTKIKCRNATFSGWMLRKREHFWSLAAQINRKRRAQTVLLLFKCLRHKSSVFYWTRPESYKSRSSNDQKSAEKGHSAINFLPFLFWEREYVWPICSSTEGHERGIYKPRPTTLKSITIFIHGNLSDSINQAQQWSFWCVRAPWKA